MAVTRANVESILVKRTGPAMVLAGMDGTTVDGTNADLNDPIGWALRQAGYSVSDITAVADADLASVVDADVDQVLDLAEYRTVETILGNADDLVNVTVGPHREDLGQLVKQLENKLERMRKRLEKAYGLGLATLQTGLITMDFVEHHPETS